MADERWSTGKVLEDNVVEDGQDKQKRARNEQLEEALFKVQERLGCRCAGVKLDCGDTQAAVAVN